MEHFDKLIKAKAQAEEISVPIGFDKRIDDMTANLVKKKVRKRTSFIAIAAVVTLTVLTGAIAFATPIGVKMTEGAISYFNTPKEFRYLSQQADFEKYNAKVGISCEDNGINITLDNIAVDDNYINVFYTLNSDEPIKLLGDEEAPLRWRLEWSAVHFWFKVDEKYIEPAAQAETEAYLVDEHTMKGMQRFAILDKLNDTFDLEIYTEEIWNREGQWHMAVNVDKSLVAVKSNTVMPNHKAKVTSGWGDKTTTHDITVKKVSVSPFGSQIVVSERGENTFHNFAIRDDKGRYLTVIPAATYGGKLFKVDNSFEFISQDKNIKGITILPIMSDGHSVMKTVSLSNLPLKLPVNNYGAYILESLEIDKEKMVAVMIQDGPVPIINPDLIPIDSEGEMLRFAASVDYDYDRETGKITLTYYWNKDVTQEELNKIVGLGYFSNDDFKINEKEAITIDLN